MKAGQRAAALVEFALAWPVALLIVLSTAEAAVWAAESYAAHAATVAGARAGAIADGTAEVAATVTLRSLAASLVGVRPSAWCPGATRTPPPVWVCATDRGQSIEVEVRGTVPALVPLFRATGLPIHAQVVLPKEKFTR